MLIALAVVFAFCEGFFTMMEVAMGAVSRARVRAIIDSEREEREGAAVRAGLQSRVESESAARQDKARNVPGELEVRATRTLSLLENHRRLTLLFITVTSLCLWTCGALLTVEASHSAWPWWALGLAFGAVLFVAEVVPLLVAARNCESLALHTSGVAQWALRLLAPLLWVLGGISKVVANALGARPGASTEVTEGELRTALATAEEEGVIESDERAL
jgi:CBS domain containing-hemolysin-like protein